MPDSEALSPAAATAAGAPAADAPVAGEPAPGEIVDERLITDLETLRMLADPLRLAVLGAIPAQPGQSPVTVKEIAEKLDEGQTKLYRHIKQLEEAGLVLVAETRVVSGIIEKRYRAAQRRLTVDGDVLRTMQSPDVLTDAIVAVLDATRTTLAADLRAGRVVLEHPAEGPDLSIHSSSVSALMKPERFAQLRADIERLIEELGPRDESPEAIPVSFEVLLYTSGKPRTPGTD